MPAGDSSFVWVMRRRKKKRRDFENLGAVLGRERGFRQALEEMAGPVSEAEWESAVGTRTAGRTRPLRLERGVLLVMTATSAWSNELSLLAEPILQNLRKLGVDVRELRFRVGSIEPLARPAHMIPKKAPNPAPLDAPLKSSLANVPDDDLRVAIERAARRALGFTLDE